MICVDMDEATNPPLLTHTPQCDMHRIFRLCRVHSLLTSPCSLVGQCFYYQYKGRSLKPVISVQEPRRFVISEMCRQRVYI